MDVFKVLPQNFFSLLNSKNQEIYVRCVLAVYKTYEQGSILGMDKSIAQQAIIDELEHVIDEIELEEIESTTSTREKANAILRRMEDCEWIDVDINNDYVEILNFRDYAITIIQALKNISQDSFYGYDDETHEFRGYIYTVYTLLQNEQAEYAMVVDQVYRNTIAFVREIRKLDSRLKFYIKSIIDNSEIKDLIGLLMNYKVELVDQAYSRLKTSDNVNKYKLAIIKKLEEYQQNPVIIDIISQEYLLSSNNNMTLARVKANKKIDDMIDIYNSLSFIIDEIDRKNKIYVNSTIAKIKFLLNDDQNVIGKLNTILRFTSDNIKKYKTEQALKTIAPLVNLKTHNVINNNSLYTPRGAYDHADAQFLLENDITPSNALQEAFYKEFETNYSEEVIKKYLQAMFKKQSIIKASDLVKEDISDETIMRLLYILVYADDDMNYYIRPLDSQIHHKRFKLNDFQIVRGQKK
jgi:hypothetical protein